MQKKVLGAVLGAFLLAGTSMAADRVVIAEEFTATWCTYCPPVGQALGQLMDENPDTFIMCQIHQSDNVTKQWGNTRATFYNVPGYPTTWLYGSKSHVGSYGTKKQNYDKFKADFDKRREGQSDVTAVIYAEQKDGQTYTITTRIGIEDGGTAKDLRVHIIQMLDNYPTGTHYRNCFMQALAAKDIKSAQPGEVHEFVDEMKFDNTSWNKKEKIKLAVWVQKPTTKGPAEIYNADGTAYPFDAPPPVWEKGDMNCDSAINFDDIDPFVDALISEGEYTTNYPDCAYMNADVNLDEVVDFNDIDPFVLLLTR